MSLCVIYFWQYWACQYHVFYFPLKSLKWPAFAICFVCNIFVAWYSICNAWSCAAIISLSVSAFRFPLDSYLLTPWCRVLLEKLTGLQLVKKFPAFHGTRRYITALTSVHHLSLSWASPIQSIYPHPTSWRSILILSSHLRADELDGLEPIRPVYEAC